MSLADAVRDALPNLRAEAEALMADSCTVARAGAPTWNEGDGTYAPGVPATVYAGRCRVRVPAVAERGAASGEQSWTVTSVVVSLPMSGSGSVRIGDTVTVTACEWDAALVDRTFTVRAAPAMTHATARRLRCEEAS